MSIDILCVEAAPNCTIIPLASVAPQVNVQLACSVFYAGRLTPVVTWTTNRTGAVLDYSTVTSRTRVESLVNVTAVDPTQVITARTHFDAPLLGKEQNAYVERATNAPSYTRGWSMTLTSNLLAPARTDQNKVYSPVVFTLKY